LLLSVEGNSISGRNGLAITDKNQVHWWEKLDDLFSADIFDEEKIDEKDLNSQSVLRLEK
jgi:hypothetical protein